MAAAGGELPPPVRRVLPNGLRPVVQDHRAADIVALYDRAVLATPPTWLTYRLDEIFQ